MSGQVEQQIVGFVSSAHILESSGFFQLLRELSGVHKGFPFGDSSGFTRQNSFDSTPRTQSLDNKLFKTPNRSTKHTIPEYHLIVRSHSPCSKNTRKKGACNSVGSRVLHCALCSGCVSRTSHKKQLAPHKLSFCGEAVVFV